MDDDITMVDLLGVKVVRCLSGNVKAPFCGAICFDHFEKDL